jgi:hypothetical protein
MEVGMSRTILLLGTLLTVLGTMDAFAAQRGPGAPTPACAVLSLTEIKTITGIQGYVDASAGDAPGQGAGGGSSCQYSGAFFASTKAPMVSLVLIPDKNWTATARTFKLAQGCNRETVSGVGDDAFFEVCPESKPIRSAPLYVKAGSKDLIIQVDIEAPATEATVRNIVIAIAKAAVAKVR